VIISKGKNVPIQLNRADGAKHGHLLSAIGLVHHLVPTRRDTWGGFYYPGQLPSQTALQSGMGLWDPVILGWPAVSCVRKNRHARRSHRPWGTARDSPFTVGPRNQLSQYGSKPVIITARDATYVLDAILGNETELAILEHTTDTAGATEIIFALFDLLGLRFTPRYAISASRRLYRSGAIT